MKINVKAGLRWCHIHNYGLCVLYFREYADNAGDAQEILEASKNSIASEICSKRLLLFLHLLIFPCIWTCIPWFICLFSIFSKVQNAQPVIVYVTPP